MIKQNQKKINVIFVFFDALIVVVCLYALPFETNLFRFTWLTAVHLICYYKFDFYKSHRAGKFIRELQSITTACLSALAVTLALIFIFVREGYGHAVYFAALNFAVLTAYKYAVRLSLRFIRSRGYNIKHLVIVGKNSQTAGFINKIEQKRGFGYRIAGIFGDDTFEGIPFLGDIDGLDGYLQNTAIDEIVITVPDEGVTLLGIIDTCNLYGVKFTIFLDIFSIFNDSFYVFDFENMFGISTHKTPLEDGRAVKRIFDIIFSLTVLILCSPVMILVYLLIKVTSKGPGIYRQPRLGIGRREFVMYKFRSMKNGGAADRMTEKNDTRLTPLGAFIRRYSIDELPQLFNVLKGDMSWVGPRPEIPRHAERFRKEIPLYMVKHYIKPGITGWAQVNGLRGNTSIEERLKYDLFYMENWSFGFDIKIIVQTLYKGIFNENAY